MRLFAFLLLVCVLFTTTHGVPFNKGENRKPKRTQEKPKVPLCPVPPELEDGAIKTYYPSPTGLKLWSPFKTSLICSYSLVSDKDCFCPVYNTTFLQNKEDFYFQYYDLSLTLYTTFFSHRTLESLNSQLYYYQNFGHEVQKSLLQIDVHQDIKRKIPKILHLFWFQPHEEPPRISSEFLDILKRNIEVLNQKEEKLWEVNVWIADYMDKLAFVSILKKVDKSIRVRLLTEVPFQDSQKEFYKQALAEKKLKMFAESIKFNILYEIGGVAIEWDTKIHQNFENLLINFEGIAVMSSEKRLVEGWLIAGKPKSGVFSSYLNSLGEIEKLEAFFLAIDQFDIERTVSMRAFLTARILYEILGLNNLDFLLLNEMSIKGVFSHLKSGQKDKIKMEKLSHDVFDFYYYFERKVEGTLLKAKDLMAKAPGLKKLPPQKGNGPNGQRQQQQQRGAGPNGRKATKAATAMGTS